MNACHGDLVHSNSDKCMVAYFTLMHKSAWWSSMRNAQRVHGGLVCPHAHVCSLV